MSLKAFHIFFIMVSSLTVIGFGVWCLVSGAAGKAMYMVMGVSSLIVGVGLIVYGKKFLEKMKREGID